ncbi:MAG: hypothetical protein DIAAKJNI_00277 [Candidatus Argoarchaeum ethanivorans]|uniref:Uncharacterized protein n=1 Tax=Candidatus Argoarchaeum ethanivorans TaxID=2608793 RepID=A0A811T9E7_9EURY|nr:MAG: hypothetical protein DIAAKJNI_00277 [Candidatus Argoarchaeum ethanivorans]
MIESPACGRSAASQRRISLSETSSGTSWSWRRRYTGGSLVSSSRYHSRRSRLTFSAVRSPVSRTISKNSCGMSSGTGIQPDRSPINETKNLHRLISSRQTEIAPHCSISFSVNPSAGQPDELNPILYATAAQLRECEPVDVVPFHMQIAECRRDEDAGGCYSCGFCWVMQRLILPPANAGNAPHLMHRLQQ